MNDISNVILLTQNTQISNRIHNIIKAENVLIHETQEPLKFLSLLKEQETNTKLIIMDFDMEIEENFALLTKVKMKKPYIPIIVMTSNNKKEVFLKSITAGAADFILKPFEDQFLCDRVERFLNSEVGQTKGSQVISKSMDEYLKAEISKASKGSYSFSISMITFFKPVNEVSLKQENEYKILSVDLYKQLKELFWVTDVFIQYGNQSFIGIFPFCGQKNTDTILNKICNRFDDIRSRDMRFEKYSLANAFVSFPEEGKDYEEIINMLTIRMKKAIAEIKSNITAKNT